MSRLLLFPCRTLEELRADELAILEDLAETRRRIVDLLEGERGSERTHPRNARGGPEEPRSERLVLFPPRDPRTGMGAPAKQAARLPREGAPKTSGGEPK